MRMFCGLVAGIGLLAAPLAWAGPLSTGKPAGIHHAAMTTSNWVVAGGLGVIALTVIAVAASGDDTPAQSGATTTTTTTTTTS